MCTRSSGTDRPDNMFIFVRIYLVIWSINMFGLQYPGLSIYFMYHCQFTFYAKYCSCFSNYHDSNYYNSIQLPQLPQLPPWLLIHAKNIFLFFLVLLRHKLIPVWWLLITNHFRFFFDIRSGVTQCLPSKTMYRNSRYWIEWCCLLLLSNDWNLLNIIRLRL